jgi:hypothetical protein
MEDGLQEIGAPPPEGIPLICEVYDPGTKYIGGNVCLPLLFVNASQGPAVPPSFDVDCSTRSIPEEVIFAQDSAVWKKSELLIEAEHVAVTVPPPPPVVAVHTPPIYVLPD